MKGHMKERSPGSWSIWIDLGRDESGRRRQKTYTVHGTKREAQRELNRILAELQSGGLVEPAKLTVGQYLLRWLADYAKPNVGAKTYERYAEIVEKHLVPALGRHPLGKLTPLQVQGYYTAALQSGRRDGKGGLSAQTVLHHHRILHAALKQAVRWQLVGRNVAEAVEPPRPAQNEMQALDADGTADLLEAARGTRLYLPVLIAVTTGMRLGEILALRWEDVDLDAGLLSVRQAMEQTRDGIGFKAPKTEKGRRKFSLPALLVDALRRHRGEQAQARLLLGPAYQDQGLVLPLEDGTPWPSRRLSKSFEHLAAAAGMPQIRFHDLRHSHASQLLAGGMEVSVVQERLGHARGSTTLNVYGHVLPGRQEQAARAVDEALGGALQRRRKADGTG